jgi:hypothetical protein
MQPKDTSDFSFTILKSLGVLSKSTGGWTKELNVISWNGRPPKFDIREWSPDHKKMGRGITLTKQEAYKIMMCFQQYPQKEA